MFLLLILAALAAYAPALNGPLLWDDLFLVQENPFFKSPIFAIEVFRHWLWLDPISQYYRPVQNLSYLADYLVWGGDPFGYHLTNILLHAASAWLLLELLRRLLPGLLSVESRSHRRVAWIAFAVALLWTVHPVHNAAVAYISGRADSLAALFALGAWLGYLHVRRASGWVKIPGFAAAGTAVVLSLASKEIAVTWLALFGVWLIWFDAETRARAKIVTLAGIFAALLGYWALRQIPGPATPPPVEALPWLERVGLMARALGDYAMLLAFPEALHMDRTLILPGNGEDLSEWQKVRYQLLAPAGCIVFLTALLLFWLRFPGTRLRVFGMVWFAIGFLPISNLFPLNATSAEHWIYMPSIGAILFGAGCFAGCPVRWAKPALAVCGALALALTARTALRSQDWASAENFFTRTMQEGIKSPRIALNLALIHCRAGELSKGEMLLRKIVRLFPDYSQARVNLAINLRQQGRAEEAAPLLAVAAKTQETVERRFAGTWRIAINTAVLAANGGRNAEALQTLDEAILRFPHAWEPVETKAKLLEETQGAADAIPVIQSWATAHWWHYEAHMRLARLETSRGNLDDALRALRHAARLDIRAAEPLRFEAVIALDRHRLPEALAAQRQAVRRAPGQPSQHLFLAAILDDLQRPAEAEKARRKARSLQAAHSEASGTLAHIDRH